MATTTTDARNVMIIQQIQTGLNPLFSDYKEELAKIGKLPSDLQEENEEVLNLLARLTAEIPVINVVPYATIARAEAAPVSTLAEMEVAFNAALKQFKTNDDSNASLKLIPANLSKLDPKQTYMPTPLLLSKVAAFAHAINQFNNHLRKDNKANMKETAEEAYASQVVTVAIITEFSPFALDGAFYDRELYHASSNSTEEHSDVINRLNFQAPAFFRQYKNLTDCSECWTLEAVKKVRQGFIGYYQEIMELHASINGKDNSEYKILAEQMAAFAKTTAAIEQLNSAKVEQLQSVQETDTLDSNEEEIDVLTKAALRIPELQKQGVLPVLSYRSHASEELTTGDAEIFDVSHAMQAVARLRAQAAIPYRSNVSNEFPTWDDGESYIVAQALANAGVDTSRTFTMSAAGTAAATASASSSSSASSSDSTRDAASASCPVGDKSHSSEKRSF